jgi:hypothetical protein
MVVADNASLPLAVHAASASPHEVTLVGETLLQSFVAGQPERLWAWLQNSRRVATRFDYHVENFLGFVHLGCIKILLRCYL